MSQTTRRFNNRFQSTLLRNDIPYPFAAGVDEETLSNEHIAWFTIYLLFVLNDREGIRLSRAAMQALSLQPLPLPLPFPNFGRHQQSLTDVIEKHQSLFSVQTESDFLEQPITLERAFYGFVRYLFLDPFEEFQTRFLNRGWNAFFTTRQMRINFMDEAEDGPLTYFGQILDLPVPSAFSSTERLKELAFTYPFPNIFSSGFMEGRGAGFLTGLVTPVTARLGINSNYRQPPLRTHLRTVAPNRSPYPGQNVPNTYISSRNGPPSYLHTRTAPISNSPPGLNGSFPSPPRNLPLAMIPMTRSRRRDQQVLAQTGFGPATFREFYSPSQRPVTHNESEHQAPAYPYWYLNRRGRQRPPIPEHMRESATIATSVNHPIIQMNHQQNTFPSLGQTHEELQLLSVNRVPSAPQYPNSEDESMMIIRVERDGQSARVLEDSNDSARRGRRVPSLQQDLGGIMDPDECTICRGSWSWIKGNRSGVPPTSPADWRLVRLPCKHTYHEECLARCCPTCRREYPSSGWVNRMVELGRRVSTTQLAESEAQPNVASHEEQNQIELHTVDTLLNQTGGSTRSSSSATSSTVIRQVNPIENESGANLESVQDSILEQASSNRSRSSSRSSFSILPELQDEVSEDLERTSGMTQNFESISTESLDSYTYDAENAMQLLNLAERLDAETESPPEVIPVPVLSDSEESEADSDPEDSETVAIENSNDEENTPMSDNRSTPDGIESLNEELRHIEDNPERASSRASISSISRIPRMTLSRMSMMTNSSALTASSTTPNQINTGISRWAAIRSHSPAVERITGTLTMRGRSGTTSRLPLPFSTGATALHAHPSELRSSDTLLGRLASQTPDRSLGYSTLSRASDRPSISGRSGTSTPGFLRPTRSSEAKASPQSPVKSERQKLFTPSKPPPKPVWK